MRWSVVAGVLQVVCLVMGYRDGNAEVIKANIAYVDIKRALNEIEEGKRVKATLKLEFRERQQKLDMMERELRVAKEALDRERLLLSSDALKEKEEAYRKSYFELDQKLTVFRQEMVAKEANLTRGILERLKAIVKEIGARDEYAMILEKSQDLVLYTPDAKDLTDEVIKAFNRSSVRRR